MTIAKNNYISNLKNMILSAGDMPDAKAASLQTIRWRLFLTSFAILFFELVCIRWLPPYVRFLGYLTNFIMLASFLGIGLGILISRRENVRLPHFFVWLFILVAVTRISQFELYLPSTQVLYYAAGEQVAPPENSIILPIMFFMVAFAFMILARPLGMLLRALPPLEAYALDILGSLAGIAAFFVISYFSLPPYIWFLTLIVILLIGSPASKWTLAVPFFLGALIAVYSMGRESYWSPYYRIQVYPNNNDGYMINVNNIGHQETARYQDKETLHFT